ncbi:hypothetical protein PICST_28766 [Scheffersomyces stipitis CBS 6054]|uniref:PSP proline-rich domain-containing protein n=1 Tax=Scheffersomyces stipitis (strain ATCC 58785 / CBS 6054 / NBRC 10063 / NRRL Y-11545) TaxID=322104 RepID=A3GGW7_PICST|nr:predicted protein [Scheffersomyces stipitis CBS 6054]EAZ63994.2 hypothetical protein PICST_28766 [Scheffersomyces stipitis CBS 6054]KAG2735246.1 hypothetical protein G9P44_001460 [Scheffersomyces stipitis]
MPPKRSKNQLRRERVKLRKLEADKKEDTLESTEIQKPDKVKDSETTNNDNKEHRNDKAHDIDTAEEQKDSVEKSVENLEDFIAIAKDSFQSVPVNTSIDESLYQQFQGVFSKFQGATVAEEEVESVPESKGDVLYNSGSDEESELESSDSEEEEELSKRQLRKRNKVPLASLKASTIRPQLVEWYDVDASDPFFLVALKTSPNAVQVPSHWSAKREYLSSKKGIERLPFQLPKFITDTGIQDMRHSDDQTLRQQQRDRVQPKMGRLDIDYQRLHDAFFKYQEKPRLLGFGDVYFEGREAADEYSNDLSSIRPGKVSSELRKALGIPEGAPPWISIMKDIGKPPAYSSLAIPGLDTSYDNDGYRDSKSVNTSKLHETEHWGKLEDYEESEEEEVDGEEEDEESDADDDEMIAYEQEEEQADDEPVKVQISEYGGIKSRPHKPVDESNEHKSLYTVIKEKQPSEGAGLLQSGFSYDLSKDSQVDETPVKQDTKVETLEPKKKFKF